MGCDQLGVVNEVNTSRSVTYAVLHVSDMPLVLVCKIINVGFDRVIMVKYNM